MKKTYTVPVLTSIILLVGWQIFAVTVSNDFLVPYPLAVLQRMLENIQDPKFYITIGNSLLRMMKGYTLSLVVACVLGFTAASNELIRRILHPLDVIVKTIPNLSYIMVFLILLGSEGSVMVTSFCVLFPVLYSAVLLSQDMLVESLKKILICYPENHFTVLFKVRIPQAIPYILEAMKTGFGLGLRVCIMAEILTQVKIGIGRQMSYDARVALDMTGLFAWTVWIILISQAGHFILDECGKIIERTVL